MTGARADPRHLARRALLIGAVGTLLAALGALVDPAASLRAWLAAAFAWTAVPVGALALLMMAELISGVWRQDLTAPLATAAWTTPLAGLLFLPVLLGIAWIYPWAADAAPAQEGFRGVYLNAWFFGLRTVIYFALWSVLAALLLRTRRPQPAVAAPGLILYTLTASLAGVDWGMSLDPEFHSSVYGLIFITHQLLAGFAWASAVRLLLDPAPAHVPMHAALLISGLLLWAYLAAMQYIIVWTGDLPDEIAWYFERSRHGWQLAVWLLALGQVALPFLLLLPSRARRSRRVVGGVALLFLAMRLLESVWLVLPAFPPSAGGPVLQALLVLAAMAGAGGLWAAAYFHGATRIPVARRRAEAGGRG